MNSNKSCKAIDTDLEQRATDRLEEMWDRALAKGDDEFFDSATKYRASNSNNKELHAHQQRPGRRGRRM
jgi:hypothetical protein